MITAKVVADSINQQGDRLTTMLITFPRIILAELNTHRMLSKNSASSRAIPFEKMVNSVERNGFEPIAWQEDHKGMQGSKYITDPRLEALCNIDWNMAKLEAISRAKLLHRNGVTKQLCNRMLEPFMMHTVLISGTEWENFFKLRCPQYSLFHENVPLSFRSKKDFLKHVHAVEAPEFKTQYDNLTTLDWLAINKGQAEIHMMALAEAMWDAINESTPAKLEPGEWHIPFGDQIKPTNDWGEFADISTKVKISTAMAARTSYTIVGDEKEISNEKLIEIHNKMATADPFHASPFEHCAIAMTENEYYNHIKGTRWMNGTVSMFGVGKSFGWCRNFKGFIQYREFIESVKHV